MIRKNSGEGNNNISNRMILQKIEKISQFMIFIFGCVAIFIVSLPATNPWQRWRYVIGLLSQPFWFYTAVYNRQPGVFLVSCVFTVSWILGISIRF